MISRWYKRLAAAITVLMVVALGALVWLDARSPVSALNPSSAAGLSGVSPSGDEYMGAYIGTDRIGWMRSTSARSEDGWKLSQSGELVITVQGQRRKVVLSGTAFTDHMYRLRAFTFKMTSEGVTLFAEGVVRKAELAVAVNAGGEIKDIKVPLKREIFLDMNMDKYLAVTGLNKGEKFELDMFDPQTLSTIPVKVEVLGTETMKIMGVEVYATRLRRVVGGAKYDSWVDINGRTLREEGPLGMMLIRETPEEGAKKGLAAGPARDLIEMASIPSSKSIPNPESLRQLRARLSGVELAPYDLHGGRQRMDGDVVTVRKAIFSEYTAKIPSTEPVLERYLKPAPLMESDNPEIAAAAREVIGGETNLLAAARRLSEHLFMKLKKKNVIGVPDALTTFNRGEGDCNEHTFLFVAMARALGIPSRPVAGVAYMGGRFYYHAWPEVFAGMWVTVDPTWGQAPADVTHIRFAGEDLAKFADIAGLMGSLKIEVLDWE
jgi:hypothetical protein